MNTKINQLTIVIACLLKQLNKDEVVISAEDFDSMTGGISIERRNGKEVVITKIENEKSNLEDKLAKLIEKLNEKLN